MSHSINNFKGNKDFQVRDNTFNMLNIAAIIFIFISIIVASYSNKLNIPIELAHWFKSVIIFMLANMCIMYIYLVKNKPGRVARWVGIINSFLLGQEIIELLYSVNMYSSSLDIEALKDGYLWTKFLTVIYIFIKYKGIGINKKGKV
ncbi:hypothetical protein, partial [Clostridium sp.]|uniref:hypothetical protein n=1 Tax=Clostridium sp. TaxID=1506 RepID=UPI003463DA9A